MTVQRHLVTRALEVASRQAGLAVGAIRAATTTATAAAWLERHQIHEARAIVPGRELDELLEALVVHESYFDRDLDQLNFIDEVILPQIAERHALMRMWSAGCATGEEPYSLAFMLARRGVLDRSIVLGTDLSRPALDRAREGRYSAWSLRTGAETPALRFLERCGADHCVPARIKNAVRFERLNLVSDDVPKDQHLVMCRNVLIYLEPQAIAAVAVQLAASLAPDGWLVVAPSDPRLDDHAPLELEVTERCLFYRLRSAPRARTPAARPRIATPPPQVRLPQPTRPAPVPAVVAAPTVRQLADRGDYQEALSLLDHQLAENPLDPELHFLAAVLRSDRDVAAALAAIDRVIYLEPDAPVAYLFAGRLHQASGDPRAAARVYRRAVALLSALPDDARVAWSDETARSLISACRTSLEALDAT